MKVYRQERECWLEECLGDGCPVRDIGCLGEHLDSLYSIHDNTSHEIYHYNGNTIVVWYRKEKIEEFKEIPSAVEGKPPVRKKTFICNSCISQVRVCGSTEEKVAQEIMDSARREHFLTPKKAEEIAKLRIKKDVQSSVGHVKKYPHVYRDPEAKLVELEAELTLRLKEAEDLANLEQVYKIVNESVE